MVRQETAMDGLAYCVSMGPSLHDGEDEEPIEGGVVKAHEERVSDF